MKDVRSSWVQLLVGALATLSLGMGGAVAYQRFADNHTCCAPGAPCCHPGSPCCAHRAQPSGLG
jgi:hypothetical protein